MNNPVVSVCMITYNHEPFIRQAIEGVLMQQAGFPVELVIGEDCSTDRTRAICEEYAETHPEIIRLLPSEKNLGMMPNFMQTLKACTGKYIALCEGDDYWTDPMKLQKQVEFLEGNPEFVLTGHEFMVLGANGRMRERKEENTKISFYGISELASEIYLQTLTVVFRNLPEVQNSYLLFSKAPMGDFALFMLLAHEGKIAVLPDIMAVRREHENGVFSGKSGAKQYWMFAATANLVDNHFELKYHKELTIGKLRTIYRIFCEETGKGKLDWQQIKMFFSLLKGFLFVRLFWQLKPVRFYKLKDLFYWLRKALK